jgi:hypothetical protein
MKNILLGTLSLFCLFLLFPKNVTAQEDLQFQASVGKYYFSASGIVSPYASVVMTSQDYFLASTVADEDGKFYLPKALVNDGLDNFCLEAIHIRRIGTSYTCFNVEVPKRDFSKDQIFLPPTVGLSGRKIEPNSSITASGYTMPSSTVNVKLGEGFWVEAKADENGFYNTELKSGIPPGKYELYATAVYGAQISEKPTRTFTIEVIGLLNKIPLWLIVLLILILILILVFILLIILWKRRRKKKKEPSKKRIKPSPLQRLLFWRA